MAPSRGDMLNNTSLGYGTLLGEICTQYQAWAWCLDLGRYVHKMRFGHGILLVKIICTRDEAWPWYPAGEDMYTS